MKTNKRSIFLLLVLAVVLLAGASGAGYAYWAGSVTAPTAEDKNASITVGTGSAVATTLTVGEQDGSGILVPAGRAQTGQVEYVILTFSVEWNETDKAAEGTTGTLSAAFKTGSVKIDNTGIADNTIGVEVQVGGEAPAGGVLKTPAPAITLGGDAVTVYVKVTLNEPADKDAYDAIINKSITFEVTFSVDSITLK